MSDRWLVKRAPEADFNDVRVYSVRRVGEAEHEGVHVWWHSRRGANCVGCSGQLVAMSKSCPHARAVKRAVRSA